MVPRRILQLQLDLAKLVAGRVRQVLNRVLNRGDSLIASLAIRQIVLLAADLVDQPLGIVACRGNHIHCKPVSLFLIVRAELYERSGYQRVRSLPRRKSGYSAVAIIGVTVSRAMLSREAARVPCLAATCAIACASMPANSPSSWAAKNGAHPSGRTR